MTTSGRSPDEIWLAATWPFVRDHLPAAPATVTEAGCGASGGHVPALLRAGYQATGVDPQAPDGPGYRQIRFEDYHPDRAAAAVVASVSLHHVDDVAVALDHVTRLLAPGGRLIVVEWISEDFDEATARWCFRHALAGQGEHGAWLAELRTEWQESALPWATFYAGWLAHHGLHSAAAIRQQLAARFRTLTENTGPYYFPDLADADAAAEQAAIDAGEIRAGRLQYAGQRQD